MEDHTDTTRRWSTPEERVEAAKVLVVTSKRRGRPVPDWVAEIIERDGVFPESSSASAAAAERRYG